MKEKKLKSQRRRTKMEMMKEKKKPEKTTNWR